MKCIKCGSNYNKKPEWLIKVSVDKDMCFDCSCVWSYIDMCVKGVPGEFNRKLTIHLDSIKIELNNQHDPR